MTRLKLASALLLLAACSAETPRSSARLRRPTDIAVVRESTPASHTFGYVANAEDGSIAKIDLATGDFIDLDRFTPGYTPKSLVPFGLGLTERPGTIVAIRGGKSLVTSNVAGEALSVLALDTPALVVVDQALPGRPAGLLAVGDDLFVALPELGAIARIPQADVGQVAAVTTIQLPDGSPLEIASKDGKTLYVGHAEHAYVSVVDVATGTVTARVPLADACRNDLDDNGDGLIDEADPGCRAGSAEGPPPEGVTVPDEVPVVQTAVLARLALSPDGALLYALNTRDRTVVVIDTATNARIDVNAEGGAGANSVLRRLGVEDIRLPGVPSEVAFARFDVAGTKRLSAYVASATGEVFVIEVEAPNGDVVHRLKNANETIDLAGVVSLVPVSVPTAPELYEGETRVDVGAARKENRPSFGEYDANTGFGITVVGHPREAFAETWDVTYGGAFLTREEPAATVSAAGELVTTEPLFCTRGVEAGDRLVVRFPQGYESGLSACSGFVGQRALAFDVSGVTENRLSLVPNSGRVFIDSEGKTHDDEARQGEGVGIYERHVNDLTAECFPGEVAYEVRVPKTWYLVKGSVGGYLHPWTVGPGGACVEDPAKAEWKGRTREWTLKPGKEQDVVCSPSDEVASDLFEGDLFENYAVSFRVIPGCETDLQTSVQRLVQTPVDTRWRFGIDSAFDPKSHKGMQSPRRLRWDEASGSLYVVDSGQEKVVEIKANADVLGSTFF